MKTTINSLPAYTNITAAFLSFQPAVTFISSQLAVACISYLPAEGFCQLSARTEAC